MKGLPDCMSAPVTRASIASGSSCEGDLEKVVGGVERTLHTGR